MTSARSTPQKISGFHRDEQLNWFTGYYDTAQPALQVADDWGVPEPTASNYREDVPSSITLNAGDYEQGHTTSVQKNVTGLLRLPVETPKLSGPEKVMWRWMFGWPAHISWQKNTDNSERNSEVLYAFFWLIHRRLNFICRRFGTLSVPSS